MAKSPTAFRTISEVSEWLETPAHVLRFWESRFSQVEPVKRAGGRRYYRPDDMRLLGGIKKLLHEDGLTIRGVQKLLREKGVRHVAGFAPPLDLEPGAPDLAQAELVQSELVQPELVQAETLQAEMLPLAAPAAAQEAEVAAPPQEAPAAPETAPESAPESAPEPAAPAPLGQHVAAQDPADDDPAFAVPGAGARLVLLSRRAPGRLAARSDEARAVLGQMQALAARMAARSGAAGSAR